MAATRVGVVLRRNVALASSFIRSCPLSVGAQAAAMSIMSAHSPAFVERQRRVEEAVARFKRERDGGVAEANAEGSLPPTASSQSDAVVVAEPLSASDSGAAARDSIMARVIADLEATGAVHHQTMRIIESSEEWKDYDAHVSFELMVLKHRYQSGDPMTTARRTQMQAHVKQKQRQIMEQHAEVAAEELLQSLTGEEVARLRDRLLRIDAPKYALESGTSAGTGAGAASSDTVSDAGMAEALWALSKDVAAAERKAGVNKGRKWPAASMAAGARTLQEMQDIMDQREEQHAAIKNARR